MTRREIHRKFDEIVAFSEVERFIDTPVKRFSSGMYLRLAFAVAAHLDPEILVVDEVLAVGDAEFQKKCLGKMGAVATEGRTVILVSHNMAAILRLCHRAVLLDRGTLISVGDSRDVVDRYLRVRDQMGSLALGARQDRQGNQHLRLLAYELRDSAGSPVPRVCTGQETTIAFRYQTQSAYPRDVHIAIGVHGSFDENLFHLSTNVSGFECDTVPPVGEMLCHIPNLPLQPGRYSFNVYCTVAGEVADWIQDAGIIEVEQGDFFTSGKLPPLQQGPFIVQHSWRVTPKRDFVCEGAEA
jgi:lipopolysaccharide transport system ATP-binding protein